MVITVKSNAKINLGLNIIGKTQNGYHLLDMVMVPISLSDTLTVKFKNKSGNLKIRSDVEEVPRGKENIVYKIYDLFFSETNLERQEIELYIKKKIPTQGGLGGGSSNGAFFFNILNRYYGNLISLERAIEITKDIGADIPFFLINKPANIKGIGEKISIIKNNIKDSIILIKPNFGVSTAVAYKNYSKIKNKKDANIKKIVEEIGLGETKNIGNYLENSLEQGLLLGDEKIMKFRKQLKNIKGIKFYMSGSGSCYYTFIKKEKAKELDLKLKEKLIGCRIEICDFL